MNSCFLKISLALLCLLLARQAPAITWKNNAASTNWNEASNWDKGVIPTVDSSVIINSCTICPSLTASVTVKNLTINSGGKANIATYTLYVLETARFSYATITSSGGIVKAISIPLLDHCTFHGSITIHRTGTKQNESWQKGNVFNGATTIISGVAGGDGQGNILDIQGDNEFKEDVVFNIYGFGMRLGFSFNAGINRFRKKLQVNFVSGSYWMVELSNGVYEGEVVANNASGGNFHLGTNNVFKQKVTLLNPHPAILYQTYGNTIFVSDCATCINTFEGVVEVINTSQRSDRYDPVDITFGRSGGRTTFTTTASLTVGNGGFRRGNLLLKNCTFQTVNPTVLSLSSATTTETYTSKLTIAGGTTFAGPVQATAPNVFLNGATFNQDVTITKTGTGTDNSVGGNVFKKKLTLTNRAGASSLMNLATQYDDLVQQ